MRWIWIDRLVEFVPRHRLTAIKTVSLSEDFIHDHFPPEEGRPMQIYMPASLILEGVAQTAGILVGSVNGFKEKVIMAKVSSAEFDADVVPGQTLRYDATIEHYDEAGASTSALIERLDPGRGLEWEPLGRVTLIFSHVDRNLAGLEFPDENFVFTGHLRLILSTAGIG